MFASWRLYAYAAVLLVTLGMGLTIKYLSVRLKHKAELVTNITKERDQAKADYAAYKQATEADARLNRTTRETLQARLTDIERSRSAVSVRCYAASVPRAAAPSGAATGADAAAIDGSSPAPLRDIGAALEDARIEALTNNARALALQEWERGRR